MGAQSGTRRSQMLRWLVGVVVVVAAVAGCTSSSGSSSGGGDKPAAGGGRGEQSSPAAQAATLSVVPAADAAAVAPADPVKVTATGGTLTSVSVAGSGGAVKGALNPDKTVWTSTDKLGFGARYTVSAVATNADGQKTTKTSAFTTARAARTVFPAVSPLSGTTVGVGMPIRVYFENPVTDRKAALARMKVTTSVPTVGGWHWFSATEVHWRPKTYWKAGTKVALDTDLRGVSLGPGTYGSVNADRHIAFRSAPRTSASPTQDPPDEGVGQRQADQGLPGQPWQGGAGPVHPQWRARRHRQEGVDDDGLDDVRAGAGRGRLQGAGEVRDPHLEQRRVRALGAVVGRPAGQGERVPRVREPGAGERAVVLRDLPAGRRRAGHRDAGAADRKDTDVPDWTIPWSQWGE